MKNNDIFDEIVKHSHASMYKGPHLVNRGRHALGFQDFREVERYCEDHPGAVPVSMVNDGFSGRWVEEGQVTAAYDVYEVYGGLSDIFIIPCYESAKEFYHSEAMEIVSRSLTIEDARRRVHYLACLEEVALSGKPGEEVVIVKTGVPELSSRYVMTYTRRFARHAIGCRMP